MLPALRESESLPALCECESRNPKPGSAEQGGHERWVWSYQSEQFRVHAHEKEDTWGVLEIRSLSVRAAEIEGLTAV